MTQVKKYILFGFWVVGVSLLTTLAVGRGTSPKRSFLLPASVPAVEAAHTVHKKERVACKECHQRVIVSTRSGDRNAPTMNSCAPCHHVPMGGNRNWSKGCEKCHVKNNGIFVAKGNTSAPYLNFSHLAHGEMSCEQCHGFNSNDMLGKIQMKRCVHCHRKKRSTLSACRTCHHVTPDGRLKTQFGADKMIPPVWMKGPTHGVDWAGNHARVAGQDSRFCANCHRETQCQGCHAGRIQPKNIHPGDWLATHGTHSTMDNPRCMSCHRTQSFCLSCHRRSGVAPDAPTSKRAKRPSQFHRGASPAKICRRARTNIAACASCHSESSCTTCHRSINPHPVGFSRRCKFLVKKNKRACAKCHDGNAERLCR